MRRCAHLPIVTVPTNALLEHREAPKPRHTRLAQAPRAVALAAASIEAWPPWVPNADEPIVEKVLCSIGLVAVREEKLAMDRPRALFDAHDWHAPRLSALL